MESPNPDLVKHTEYPIVNSFGDSHPSTTIVQVSDDINGDNEKTKASKAVGETGVVSIPEEGENKSESKNLVPRTFQPSSEHHNVVLATPSGLNQFAIEDHLRNTDKNPTKESTNMLPFLVRKTHSYELLPKPIRTTNQFICLSYLSFIFCCMIGATATHYAWKTKLQRNKGLYVAAKRSAKIATKLMIAAFVSGLLIVALNLIIHFVTNG